MGSNDPLVLGMFWGGLLMAAIPIGFSLGVGVYLLRRYLRTRRQEPSE